MTRLARLVAALALVSAVTGLAWDGAYAGNDAFKAAGYRGSDVLTLLMIPFLLWAAGGSPRGRLLLGGAFLYFAYLYASVALNAAYGDLFLLHTAIFGASVFGLVGAVRAMPPVPAPAPVWVARFLLASAAATAFILLSELAGDPDLHGSTTLVTHVLDIGLIVPAVALAGVLLRRRDPDGYRLALPLLVLEVTLLPMIALQTALQLDAGVDFAPAEIAGPITGFCVFAAIAAIALRSLLRLAAPPESLAGDDLVPAPDWVTTRSVHIRAPRAAVWPWLVQMGYPTQRAGWYTPHWLDRLTFGIRGRSADRIVEELQELAVGDVVPDSADGTAYFEVQRVEPREALVLFSTRHVLPPYADLRFSWAFVLQDEGDGCRLVIRARAAYRPVWPRPLVRLFVAIVMTPGDLVNVRAMLRGIRRRAERPRRSARDLVLHRSGTAQSPR